MSLLHCWVIVSRLMKRDDVTLFFYMRVSDDDMPLAAGRDEFDDDNASAAE